MKVVNQTQCGINAPFWGQAASLCLLVVAQCALANPTGGQITSGSAVITNSATTTTITQTSNKAIINWQDFSVNPNEITEFKQPSSNSFTLNRVTGNNASQILGSIKANGNIYIINPNGILFGKTARVDVGGLVASTSPISDKSFLSNEPQVFDQSRSDVSIINQGNISVKNAGIAVLVSPNVINQGVIQANMGKIEIAGADHFTLDLYGDNLITFDATGSMGKTLVENDGTISANGGRVYITAQAADQMIENLINMYGYVEAKTVTNNNGKVYLGSALIKGNKNSIVDVSGTIDVSGAQQGQTGGLLQVTGDYIKLQNSSLLDASGYSGGGNIHIGSDVFHNPTDNLAINTLGLPTALPTAQYVYAAPDSRINANALSSGDGGNVVVWADENTWYYGNISAAAKGSSGNGGRIETSGKNYLDVSNIKVDASSLTGKTGLWLLDPADITVSQTSATSNGSFSGGNPNTFTPTTTATVQGSDISTALATANVIISTGGGAGNNSITFDTTFDGTNPITWSTGNSLTFLATGNIVINASAAGSLIINPTNATGTATVNFRSDSNSDGVGTVTYTNGLINQGGAGNVAVNVYYNPVDFSTPVDYSSLVGGGATLTSYMLVHDTVAGHTLADIGLDSTTLAQTYALSQNISSNLVDFVPIGSTGTPFTGTLSGANYTGTPYSISGLTQTGADAALLGLFGVTSNAQLRDLTLNDFTLNDNGRDVIAGPLVAQALANTNISNVIVNDPHLSVIYNDGQEPSFGGLIGQGFDTSISNVTINSPVMTSVYLIGLFTYAYFGGVAGTLSYDSVVPTASNITVNNAQISGSIPPDPISFERQFTLGGFAGSVTMGTLPGSFSNITVNNLSMEGYGISAGIIGQIAGSTGILTLSNLVLNGGNILGYQSAGLLGSVSSRINFIGTNSNSANVTENNRDVLFNGMGGLIANLSSDSNTLSGSFTNTGIVTGTGAITSGTSAYTAGILGLFSGRNNIFSGTFFNSGSVSSSFSGNSGTAGIIGADRGTGGNTYSGTFTNTGNVTSTGASISVVLRTGGVFGTAGENSSTTSTFSGTFTNSGTIAGDSRVGGIAGLIRRGILSGSFTNNGAVFANASSVSGGEAALGGVMGWVNTSTISGSLINNGAVTVLNPITGGVTQMTGGVIGLSGSLGGNTFTSAAILTNHGTVISGNATGGVIGRDIGSSSYNGTYTNTGDVNPLVAFGNNIGGVFGLSGGSNLLGTFTSSGTVRGFDNVGGVIGMFANNGVGTARLNSASVLSNTGGHVYGVNAVGGLIGNFATGTYSALLAYSNAADVTGTGNYTGGIYGYISTTVGSILNPLTNSGAVTGTNLTGGVAGNAISNFNQTLTNNGVVNGTTSTGGIFGFYNGTGTGSLVNTANVTGTDGVGGLVGSNSGSWSQAELTSVTVTGSSNVGGLAGTNAGTISQSVVQSGTVTGSTTRVGGIVGYNTGTVSNTSFGGTLSASAASNVGGIAGQNDGTIQYALGIGPVTGLTGSTGALVGVNSASGQLRNAFYDTTINDTLSAYGSNAGTVTSVYGADANTLDSLSTYTNNGFSPAVWQLITGHYASLIWCGSACLKTLTPAPPIPPVPPTPPTPPTPDIPGTLPQIIQTQIVNAENLYVDESLYYVSPSLVLTYGYTLLNKMNFSDTPSGAMATWFVTNSIIFQPIYYGPGITENAINVMYRALDLMVKSEQSNLNTPVS